MNKILWPTVSLLLMLSCGYGDGNGDLVSVEGSENDGLSVPRGVSQDSAIGVSSLSLNQKFRKSCLHSVKTSLPLIGGGYNIDGFFDEWVNGESVIKDLLGDTGSENDLGDTKINIYNGDIYIAVSGVNLSERTSINFDFYILDNKSYSGASLKKVRRISVEKDKLVLDDFFRTYLVPRDFYEVKQGKDGVEIRYDKNLSIGEVLNSNVWGIKVSTAEPSGSDESSLQFFPGLNSHSKEFFLTGCLDDEYTSLKLSIQELASKDVIKGSDPTVAEDVFSMVREVESRLSTVVSGELLPTSTAIPVIVDSYSLVWPRESMSRLEALYFLTAGSRFILMGRKRDINDVNIHRFSILDTSLAMTQGIFAKHFVDSRVAEIYIGEKVSEISRGFGTYQLVMLMLDDTVSPWIKLGNLIDVAGISTKTEPSEFSKMSLKRFISRLRSAYPNKALFIGSEEDVVEKIQKEFRDFDGDGVPDFLERLYSMNPRSSDSDQDGWSDLSEIIFTKGLENNMAQSRDINPEFMVADGNFGDAMDLAPGSVLTDGAEEVISCPGLANIDNYLSISSSKGIYVGLRSRDSEDDGLSIRFEVGIDFVSVGRKYMVISRSGTRKISIFDGDTGATIANNWLPYLLNGSDFEVFLESEILPINLESGSEIKFQIRSFLDNDKNTICDETIVFSSLLK